MSEIITIYDGPDACGQCLGWKRIASSDDGESWKYWAELSPPENIAVQLGVVYPVVCPHCHGSGKEPAIGGSEEVALADGNIREIHRLQGLLALAEADAAVLRQTLETSLKIYCGRCGGCHRCTRELPVLDAEHPGAALLAELAELRAERDRLRVRSIARIPVD